MSSLADRAFQFWPLLVFAARNRRLLTYDEVQDCTGMIRVGQGPVLERIASFCAEKGFPPLTVLVVSKSDGLPSYGFHSVEIESPGVFAGALNEVFEFDWSRKGPNLEDLG